MACGLLLGVGGLGYHLGQRSEQLAHSQAIAQQQQATLRAADLASRKELERLREVAAREEAQWLLEEAAKADADKTCTLSLGRVDRLRKR